MVVRSAQAPNLTLRRGLLCRLDQSFHQLLQRDTKCVTDAQQSVHRDRTPGFNHLPVARTETEPDHILLGQLSFNAASTDPPAKIPKKLRISGRKRSADTHSSRLVFHQQKNHEQKIHEQKVRNLCYDLWTRIPRGMNLRRGAGRDTSLPSPAAMAAGIGTCCEPKTDGPSETDGAADPTGGNGDLFLFGDL